MGKTGHDYRNTQRWKNIRRWYRVNVILCEDCGKAPVEDVHHIVAIHAGGSPYEQSNLRGLCKKCHRTYTNIEIGDRAALAKGSTLVGKDGFPL